MEEIDSIDFLGLIAGFLTTISFIPQLVKTWRSKSAKDVSIVMFICFMCGVCLWCIYGWEIHVWHGDHCWHKKSGEFAKGLKDWCERNNLDFFTDQATKSEISTEAAARNWRYKNLMNRAKLISSQNQSSPRSFSSRSFRRHHHKTKPSHKSSGR